MDAYTEPDRKTRIDAVLNRLHKYIEADNIADELDDDVLTDIGHKVVAEFEIDERSNEEWIKTARKSMDAALQVRQAKNYPFPGASNVKYPLITVAALQFNARSYPEIVNGDQIVNAKVVGEDQDGTKQAKADRISEHMSYQLLEEMEGWEEDTDTLLMQLPIIGCAFKKVYYDTGAKRNCSEMISALDLIVNRTTRSLMDAPRITHQFPLYPQQVEERIRDGRWIECDLGEPPDAEGDPDAPHQFLEQHRWLDLDKDGFSEPYIVTVHKETNKIVRIVANYAEGDITLEGNEVTRIEKRDYFVKFAFIPDPKGGFYDIGFGALLESLGAAIDTTINQMLDAGHLQNAGGGFIGSGIRLKKGVISLTPGVYKTIDASGAKLREAIYNFEHPGPSAVLFTLLGMMIDAAKDITAVKDILTGDSGEKGVQTATTTLALIEQGMKVFTAIYKRIYRALRQEFKLLFRLNAENLPDEAYFNVLDTPKAVARTDYEEGSYDVCPQADPKLVTDMQRVARAQVLMNFIGNPMVNQQAILKRVFLATGQENVEELLEVQQVPPDPLMVAKAAEAEASAGLKQAQTQKTTADIVMGGIDMKMRATEMALTHGDGREDAARAERNAAEDRKANKEAKVKAVSEGRPAKAKARKPKAALVPGDVVDGFEFTGGNPADRKNWQKKS